MTEAELDLRTLQIALDALEALRKLRPTMTVASAQTFLTIALFPDLTMTEIAKRLNVEQPIVSRYMYALSEWEKAGVPGLDLVSATIDPSNRAKKILSLTHRGRQVISGICARGGYLVRKMSQPQRASNQANA